jgi:hypothetical protein
MSASDPDIREASSWPPLVSEDNLLFELDQIF